MFSSPGILWPAGCTSQPGKITCNNTAGRLVDVAAGNNPVQVHACQAVRALPVVAPVPLLPVLTPPVLAPVQLPQPVLTPLALVPVQLPLPVLIPLALVPVQLLLPVLIPLVLVQVLVPVELWLV